MRTFPLVLKVGISCFMVWMYAGTVITTSTVFKVKDEEMKPVKFIFYLIKVFCNKREITHFCNAFSQNDENDRNADCTSTNLAHFSQNNRNLGCGQCWVFVTFWCGSGSPDPYL